jgi:hypothetical protein
MQLICFSGGAELPERGDVMHMVSASILPSTTDLAAVAIPLPGSILLLLPFGTIIIWLIAPQAGISKLVDSFLLYGDPITHCAELVWGKI